MKQLGVAEEADLQAYYEDANLRPQLGPHFLEAKSQYIQAQIFTNYLMNSQASLDSLKQKIYEKDGL